MIDNVNGVVFGVFIFLFLLVTVLGFAAARWRRADLDSLDEWGLGGRGFGTFIAWFLIGGDIYTAYTFIAVPATLYAGSAVGFFAVPYTIVVYPLIFLFLPRLWSVSHRHGYVTPADFVQGRYDSRGLALVIALTGILATMPYIALQLVGMEVVLQVMGIGTTSDTWFVQHLPLFIAFGVLAAYTYSSGLRAPALIAFVKDTLIYIVILVAVFYIPSQIGGWDHIFSTVTDGFADFNATNADAIAAGDAAPKAVMPPPPLQWAYASLALGSALALFMYPHSVTGVLSTRSRSVIRRNAALLPAYSFLLGCSPSSASSRSRRASRSTTRSSRCRSSSRTSSARGSPASRSRPSSSARWCRRRSCRSPPPTCGPATSTGPSSTAARPPSRRRRRASWSRCW